MRSSKSFLLLPILTIMTGCGGLFKPPETRINEPYSVKFTPDGSQVIAGYFVTVIREDSEGEPDIDTQSMIRMLNAANGQVEQSIRQGDGVWDLDLSPDGRIIASADDDDRIKLYDRLTAAPIRSFTHPVGPLSLAFSPDGGLLASGGWDRTIRLWNPATGSQIRILTGHSDGVYGVEFSPDSRILASTGSVDGTVKLWDALNGSLLRNFDTGKRYVSDVDFSPDGRLLAVGGGNEVLIYDLQAGVQVDELDEHRGQVTAVAFSPDGTRLATGAGEGDWDILLWDVATRSLIRELIGHRAQVFSLAWSPDSARLASGSGDTTVRLWSPATGQQLWASGRAEPAASRADRSRRLFRD